METEQQLQLVRANPHACPSHLAEIIQAEQELQSAPFSISIGTGDMANLAYGLPLFPTIGASRAAITSNSRSNSIVDFEFTILFSRTKFHSYYSYFMGVLGPAIAFDLPASVALTNVSGGSGQVAATLSNQQVVAGLLIGIAAGAGFTLTQQLYLPENWYSPWKFTWQQVFELNKSFEVDILSLLFKLIEKLIGLSVSKGTISKATGSKLNRYLNYGKATAEAIEFVDINNNGFGPNNIVTAAPNLTVPIDLVTAIPELKPFVEGLSRLVGQMEFGPQFTVAMPVDLKLNDFVLRGAQGGASEATYGPIRYTGNTAVANGPGFINTPGRFTTKVTYTTRFTVALSFFFKISLCKLYSYQWTSGSLDLLALLNLPIPSTEVTGRVSTQVATGCVLIPQMTLNFVNGFVDPYYGKPPENTALVGLPVKVSILLDQPWGGQDTDVAITISPQVSGFPSSMRIARGQEEVQFRYTFPQQCIVSGDPKQPYLIPPTYASPYQSYLVTAKIIASDPAQPCADFEVAAPVKVTNRVIQVGLELRNQMNTKGPAPAYYGRAGGQMNADPSRKPTNVYNYAQVTYGFPFAAGTGPVENVPVDVYLLGGGDEKDEMRKPIGAHLKITFDSGATAVLTQPARLNVPLYPYPLNGEPGRTFQLEWTDASPEDVNFSSLFILVINGGCGFGQAEFWVNAWNWR